MIRVFYISIILTLLFASCTDEDFASREKEQDFAPANLTFTIDMSDINVGTRGYAYMENWDSAEGWSLWDKYVDGRLFYRLTVFLMDDENTLVAYRDIYRGSGDLSENNGFLNSSGDVDTALEYGDKARVTFHFSSPLHGDAEKLHSGKYRLMAVANFSECSATDASGTLRTYSGLNIATTINDIKTAFNSNPAQGIVNFTTSYASNFMDYKLDAGDDRVCAQQPMPLSLVEDINLSPGDNMIGGELLRAYARLRIVIENNAMHDSKDLTLTVNNFALSNNYAQRYAYLFGEPGNDERFYENALSRGQINVSSADAIHPFSKTNIGEIDTSNPQSNDAVIFDAYILESRDMSNSYTYTLGLGYNLNGAAAFTMNGEVRDHNNLKAGTLYLIKRNNNNNYLTEGYGSVGVTDVQSMTSDKISESMVWQLEAGPYYGTYYIRTIDPGSDTRYYMQQPTASAVPLAASRPSMHYTFSTNNNLISMRYEGGFHVTANGSAYGTNWDSGWYADNNMRQFIFYPLTQTNAAGVSKTETIVLKTIDEVTSQVTEVTNIKRNDFIDVLVTVSYVPDSENGYFTFEVEGWTKKNNNSIEFE